MAEETKSTTTEETTDNFDYKSEYERLKSSYDKLKSANDKTSSENAEYKRKERERMSAEEQKLAETEEREKYYKALERENAVHRYTSKLGSVIKDQKALTEIAELMADGEYDKALEKQTEYLAKDRDTLEKQIKSDLMKQNPQPRPQNGGATKTKEEIMAIADTDLRQAEIAKNIHLFT
jgi:hypothetical protein